MSDKRADYISWDEYFMGVAHLSGMRSKDPSTQVGCCIVNDKNRILSMGYNGLPTGCSDDEFPWDREGDELDTKYPYVCNAEFNSIMHFAGSKAMLNGAKVYVTLFPCNECAKAIAQSGIKEVVFLSDKYKDTNSSKAARRIFDKCGIKYRQLELSRHTQLV